MELKNLVWDCLDLTIFGSTDGIVFLDTPVSLDSIEYTIDTAKIMGYYDLKGNKQVIAYAPADDFKAKDTLHRLYGHYWIEISGRLGVEVRLFFMDMIY